MKRCIAVIGAAVLFAFAAQAEDWPRYETSLNYTFTRFNASTNGPRVPFDANGGSGQFAWNLNRWLSGVLDVGAVNNGDIRNTHIDSTIMSFMAGPRVSLRKGRVTPYIQSLYGGVYSMSSVTRPSEFVGDILISPETTIHDRQTAFAMTAGFGVDFKISKHVSFRPIQAEYFLTRLPNFVDYSRDNEHNFRYSAGVNFTFGGEEPAPPPAPVQPHNKTCPDGSTVPANAPCPLRNLSLSLTTTQQEICQGENAQINVELTGADSKQVNFHWTVNGQAVSQEHSLSFGTADRQPGTYTVALSVEGPGFHPANAQTTISVREYKPPTATVQASPSEIYAGETATITSHCDGQCGGNLQAPAFTVSEGSVQGDQFDSSSVQFDPSDNGEQRKTVRITAACSDDKNTGNASATITVIKKAAIVATRLPDVLFDANSARVNNCGKRILLEQLRGYTERDSGGKVVLVGHVSADEKAGSLAEQRAMNAAAVITAGTGVCSSIPQSQVLVSSPGVEQNGVGYEASFCSASVRKGSTEAAEMRRVEVWFVPTNGQLPSSLKTYQDASALPVTALGCPK